MYLIRKVLRDFPAENFKEELKKAFFKTKRFVSYQPAVTGDGVGNRHYNSAKWVARTSSLQKVAGHQIDSHDCKVAYTQQ